MNKTVHYFGNKYGYVVAVCDPSGILELNTSGNSPHCSQTFVDPEDGVGAEQLKTWALKEAKERAEELGLPKSCLVEDPDLAGNISEDEEG
jgi:glycine/D-amino acid oxidase-like deaminating enzyme